MTARAGWALACVVAVACVGCGERAEHSEVTHESRRAALKAGALVTGRIPPWLPQSAREVREARDPKTTRSMLAFRFDRLDRLSLPSSCAPVPDVPAPPFRVSWWPRDIPSGGSATLRYVLYSCESGRAFLAIRVGDGEAYYWRP